METNAHLDRVNNLKNGRLIELDKTLQIKNDEKRDKIKNEILSLLRKVNRHGMEKLIEWLETSTFFSMPASTRFHGNYDGGLAEHSLNVYKALIQLRQVYQKQFGISNDMPIESVILVSLCHDFCKIDLYKKDFRNVKNTETGQWERKPVYVFDDLLGMGHGEASVYILQSFINLTREEALAIRWHMGAFDSAVKAGDRSIYVAQEQYPLVVLLHMADQWATAFMEETVE